MANEIQLTSNFALRKANIRDFCIYWAIYDNNFPINGIEMNINAIKHFKDNGYWVLLGNNKIGGAMNHFGSSLRYFLRMMSIFMVY
ncbi:MAG: hypothetical protein ACW981_13685 [Candidatus Hodarchaeales archaeon]|jgi:hypothetical protein